MERKRNKRSGLKIILLAAINLLLYHNALAQATTADWDCRIHKAYVNADIHEWLKLLVTRESELVKASAGDELFGLALAYYGYTGYLVQKKQYADAKIYQAKTERLLDRLRRGNYKPSRVEAIQASLTAFGMAMNRARAMILGPRSMNQINAALKDDPACPYAIGERGNSEFHRPSFAGGSYSKAAVSYAQAISILEKEHKDHCNWYYSFLLIRQVRSLEKAGKTAEAAQVRGKIQKLEPKLLQLSQ